MNAAGLLAGYTEDVTIENCYAEGRILEDGRYQYQTRNIGGLVGNGDNWYDLNLSNCYARVDMDADMSGDLYVTGYGLIGSYEPHGTITNCYATGNVETPDAYSFSGAFVGQNNGKIDYIQSSYSFSFSSSFTAFLTGFFSCTYSKNPVSIQASTNSFGIS